MQTFFRLCSHQSFLHLKPDFRYSSLSLDKLTTNWQNFARVKPQLFINAASSPPPEPLELCHKASHIFSADARELKVAV